MLKCEGHKMFRGSALITPKNATMLPFRVESEESDWLYKPDAKCWYCNGHSFPEEIVGDIQEAE